MLNAARILFVTGFAALVACSIAELPGTGGYNIDAVNGDGDSSVEGGQPACVERPTRIEKVDLATLPACQCKAGGRAHCISTTKLPDSLARPLAACEDTTGRCVPDTVIESGGEPFATCKASGEEGRCVTLCVPRVEKYAEALTRGDGDTCLPDEKCIPCKMPNGKSSGICEVGSEVTCVDGGAPPGTPDGGIDPNAPLEVACPYTGTKMSVTQMPACAPGGRCVSVPFLESVITSEQTRAELKARLATCVLGYCVPEAYLLNYGQYKPPTCTAFAGIEGRCFSVVFKDVDAEKELLSRDSCAENDRCIPCFNPADGAPSGACTTVSCDSATTVPPTLQDCCFQGDSTRGKCIPKKDIPVDFQSRLTWYECNADTELCVPSENVDLKSVPSTCVPATAVPVPNPTTNGVCVSRCLRLSWVEGLVYLQGACRGDQICAPCFSPTNNLPTGAPGCKY